VSEVINDELPEGVMRGEIITDKEEVFKVGMVRPIVTFVG
jgi:hypothetical protein